MDTHKLSSPLRWAHTFTVAGRVPFPIDMLRYDACVPDTSADANVIAADKFRHAAEGDMRVTLVHYSTERTWQPEYGRWHSFGWRIVG